MSLVCKQKVETPLLSKSLPHKAYVQKLFSKYAYSLWPESYSANVDILGQLYGILRFYNNCLKKNILIQNG